MTRPPFAEFSSVAIDALMKWIGGNAVWSGRLNEVLEEHFLPVVEEAGLDPEEAWNSLGVSMGPVYGTALEDLCTRHFDDPPHNAVADFLKKRGLRLPPLAKAYLEALRASNPSMYEVVAVEPGRGVALRDLVIEGEPFKVIEISGSRQIVQWDRLVARVVEHGAQRVFTGGMFRLSTERSESALGELRELTHRLARESGMASEAFHDTLREVLRDAAPLFGGLHVAQVLPELRKPPKLVNGEGDPLEFAEARYPVSPGARRDVIARLDGAPELPRAGDRPPKWDWIADPSALPQRSQAAEGLSLTTLRDGDPKRLVLANLTLAADQLELSVNSRRRLENARAFVEALLSGLVGTPEVRVKSVEQVMAEQPRKPEAGQTLPKAVEGEAVRQYLDSHYREWLDQKIPALGGKTPREMARDFEGRERLAALMKEVENRTARQARDTGLEYDTLWLWRELGIEHLRR